MYWNGNDYDKTAQLVIDIYMDYNITSFPVDEKEICKKNGAEINSIFRLYRKRAGIIEETF